MTKAEKLRRQWAGAVKAAIRAYRKRGLPIPAPLPPDPPDPLTLDLRRRIAALERRAAGG